MKTAIVSIGVIFTFTVLFAAGSFAQQGMRGKGSGGWGPASAYNRLYDSKTVESIRGEVLSVDTMTYRGGMSYGIRLMVKTDKETLPVHLGPGWYIQKQDVQIEVKDVIQVKGSRISFEGAPALIAAEVQKGDEILKLRDNHGYPAWSGWRKR